MSQLGGAAAAASGDAGKAVAPAIGTTPFSAAVSSANKENLVLLTLVFLSLGFPVGRDQDTPSRGGQGAADEEEQQRGAQTGSANTGAAGPDRHVTAGAPADLGAPAAGPRLRIWTRAAHARQTRAGARGGETTRWTSGAAVAGGAGAPGRGAASSRHAHHATSLSTVGGGCAAVRARPGPTSGGALVAPDVPHEVDARGTEVLIAFV